MIAPRPARNFTEVKAVVDVSLFLAAFPFDDREKLYCLKSDSLQCGENVNLEGNRSILTAIGFELTQCRPKT
jgi:hypothetical protein